MPDRHRAFSHLLGLAILALAAAALYAGLVRRPVTKLPQSITEAMADVRPPLPPPLPPPTLVLPELPALTPPALPDRPFVVPPPKR